MIRLKSEIEDILNLFCESDFEATTMEGSSDGCSPKYTNDSVWIKVDAHGYEALAEVLSSRAVRALDSLF